MCTYVCARVFVCISLPLCVSPPRAEGRCHSLLAPSHRALAATSQQPLIRQPFQVDELMPDNNVVWLLKWRSNWLILWCVWGQASEESRSMVLIRLGTDSSFNPQEDEQWRERRWKKKRGEWPFQSVPKKATSLSKWRPSCIRAGVFFQDENSFEDKEIEQGPHVTYWIKWKG